MPDRPTTAGTTAIMISPAIRATALLIADATPACASSTAASTVAVSGATVNTSPTPSTTTPGNTPDQYDTPGLDPRQQRDPRGRDQRADRHRDARADALRDAPARAEKQQHQHRQREQRRAGFERGVAEVGLQVHDEQEHRDAERGVDRERDRVRAGELPRPEHVERHHRVRRPRLDHDEAHERHHARDQREHRRARPPGARALDQPVDHAREAERRAARRRDVDVARRGDVTRLGHVTQRDHDRHRR